MKSLSALLAALFLTVVVCQKTEILQSKEPKFEMIYATVKKTNSNSTFRVSLTITNVDVSSMNKINRGFWMGIGIMQEKPPSPLRDWIICEITVVKLEKSD